MKIKIGLRPGTKLSEHFANRRDCYKIVELDNVLGYVVSGGGRESAAAIYPLYRADIHVKAGKTWHIVSSFEQGERLNAYTFHEDYEGCTFATIASQSIRALEERRHVQQLVKQVAAKKRRTKAR
jgi:hypothetical protein